MLATTPFMNDGLTKIEMDVYEYNKSHIEFEFASSFGFDNEYGSRLKSEGVKCRLLKKKKNVVMYMLSIMKLIRQQKYDAVYIHGNSAMMFIETLPTRLGGCKEIITHCHNTSTKFPVFHYLFKPIFNLLVDKKIACSKLAAKWAYFGKNQYVILNGIQKEKFCFSTNSAMMMKKKLGWENNTVVGHIGRFNYQKNHKKIIDVFRKYSEKDATARLLLIGEGELKDEIVNYVMKNDLADKVKFIGTTDNVAGYMCAMDVFLLPSLFEGLGIVLVEAQANGLPIVISSVCPNEVKIARNVLECKVSDSDEIWADMLEKAIIIGRNKEDVLDESIWSIDAMMKKIADIIVG